MTTPIQNNDIEPIHQCPYCGQPTVLCIQATPDGREWVDMACPPCNAGTAPDGKWTLFVGK